jgi:hypothetical protein
MVLKEAVTYSCQLERVYPFIFAEPLKQENSDWGMMISAF